MTSQCKQPDFDPQFVTLSYLLLLAFVQRSLEACNTTSKDDSATAPESGFTFVENPLKTDMASLEVPTQHNNRRPTQSVIQLSIYKGLQSSGLPPAQPSEGFLTVLKRTKKACKTNLSSIQIENSDVHNLSWVLRHTLASLHSWCSMTTQDPSTEQKHLQTNVKSLEGITSWLSAARNHCLGNLPFIQTLCQVSNL